jgi:alpha-glucosidase
MRLWDIDDAFMLGDALLVAPIFEGGATSRNIVLPRGDWYNFWQNDDVASERMFYKGPGKVEVAVSIERIPVLVRAGTILPMEEDGKLILHIYPISAPDSSIVARGALYSDPGDGYEAYRVDHFHMDRTVEGYELNHISEGDYPFPDTHLTLHLHGSKITHVSVDGNEVMFDGNRVEVGNFKQATFAITGSDINLDRQ